MASSLFIATFSLGWTTGILAFYVPQPGYGIWKYALAQPVALLSVAVADIIRIRTGGLGRARVIGAFMTLALLVTDSRNLAISVALSFGIAPIARKVAAGRTKYSPAGLWARIGLVAAGLVALLWLGLASGAFGTAARDKWEAQGGNPVAVLLYGRAELKFTVDVISQHPLKGYGMQGPLPSDVVRQAAQTLSGHPSNEQAGIIKRLAATQINGHSGIGDMWLRGGPVAALPLVVALALGGRCLRGRVGGSAQYTQIFLFASIAWDFLFSPWTYYSGAYWGVAIGFLLASQAPNAKAIVPGVGLTRNELPADRQLERTQQRTQG